MIQPHQARPTTRKVHEALRAAGLSVVPLAFRRKNTTVQWKKAESDLDAFPLSRWGDAHDKREAIGQPNGLALVGGKVSGVIFLDIDDRETANRFLSATAFSPPPWMTVTSKGLHVAFAVPDEIPIEHVRNKAKIAIRIGGQEFRTDIRGDGGYVVAPFSFHQDTGVMYRPTQWPWTSGDRARLPKLDPQWTLIFTRDVPVPDRPGEKRQVVEERTIAEEVARKKADAERAAGPLRRDGYVRTNTGNAPVDERNAFERARAYAARVPGAVQGQGGDEHTYKLACKIARGFNLDDGETARVLQEWNEKCNPPWTDEELQRKIESARKYGKEEYGNMLVARQRDGENKPDQKKPDPKAPIPATGFEILPGDINAWARSLDPVSFAKHLQRHLDHLNRVIGFLEEAGKPVPLELIEASLTKRFCRLAIPRHYDPLQRARFEAEADQDEPPDEPEWDESGEPSLPDEEEDPRERLKLRFLEDIEVAELRRVRDATPSPFMFDQLIESILVDRGDRPLTDKDREEVAEFRRKQKSVVSMINAVAQCGQVSANWLCPDPGHGLRAKRRHRCERAALCPTCAVVRGRTQRHWIEEWWSDATRYVALVKKVGFLQDIGDIKTDRNTVVDLVDGAPYVAVVSTRRVAVICPENLFATPIDLPPGVEARLLSRAEAAELFESVWTESAHHFADLLRELSHTPDPRARERLQSKVARFPFLESPHHPRATTNKAGKLLLELPTNEEIRAFVKERARQRRVKETPGIDSTPLDAYCCDQILGWDDEKQRPIYCESRLNGVIFDAKTGDYVCDIDPSLKPYRVKKVVAEAARWAVEDRGPLRKPLHRTRPEKHAELRIVGRLVYIPPNRYAPPAAAPPPATLAG